MANYKLSGVVKQIHPTTQISKKFSKREFVVTDTEGMYEQHIQMQLVKDKCDLLNGVNVGDKVSVEFNLKGREWVSPSGEVKYFNTIEAFRVDINERGSTQAQATTPEVDDLPF